MEIIQSNDVVFDVEIWYQVIDRSSLTRPFGRVKFFGKFPTRAQAEKRMRNLHTQHKSKYGCDAGELEILEYKQFAKRLHANT